MKSTITLVSVVALLFLIAIMFGGNKTKTEGQSVLTNGDGASQIVEIDAKGGYSPQVIRARAGIPTTLKITTRGTFDCSSALVIPDLKYQKNLPPTGVTEVEIPPQPAGSNMKGLCQMGMYDFIIYFD